MPRRSVQFRPAAARLSIRVTLEGGIRLGPGKVALLELIAEQGSISAAAREMGMSYRRAWLLVDSLNAVTREPVIVSRAGGRRGGGARLTPTGRELVRRYHAMQQRARETLATELAAVSALGRGES